MHPPCIASFCMSHAPEMPCFLSRHLCRSSSVLQVIGFWRWDTEKETQPCLPVRQAPWLTAKQVWSSPDRERVGELKEMNGCLFCLCVCSSLLSVSKTELENARTKMFKHGLCTFCELLPWWFDILWFFILRMNNGNFWNIGGMDKKEEKNSYWVLKGWTHREMMTSRKKKMFWANTQR